MWPGRSACSCSLGQLQRAPCLHGRQQAPYFVCPRSEKWEVAALQAELPCSVLTSVTSALRTGAQMVLYIEACESGSMFEGLLDSHQGVYAVSASNSVESSWGTYCPGREVCSGC